MKKQKLGFITLPAAIVIAAAIIAVAIIWVSGPARNTTKNAGADNVNGNINLGPVINIRAITSADHILGNPNAAIKILEYSDTACPFCKVFSPTMEKVMANYGAGGSVAWVYRSFPLTSIHPNSVHESEAMECADEVGGNDKYWIFLKRLYEITPSVTSQTPDGLDQKQLPIIAKFAGIDVAAFNTCLESGRMNSKVEADYTDGVNAGVNGTPASIFVLSAPATKAVEQVITNINQQLRLQSGQLVISSDRNKIFMSGALPYETIKSIIDALLAK